jgi:phenylacetate-coenzyme A ligase PaaK-like adenylate-forming protein
MLKKKQPMESAIMHVHLKNEDCYKWLRFFKESENWQADQIADYQLRETKSIVQHAYEHSKAYGDCMTTPA